MSARTARSEADGDLIRLMLDPRGEREWSPAEARAARDRVAADPRLSRRLERLRSIWSDVELEPPAPAPPGFTTRLVARALQERRNRAHPVLAWGSAPLWARVAAILALGVGLATGPLLVTTLPPPRAEGTTASLEELVSTEWVSAEPGLAELYLDALQEEPGIGEVPQ